jgi:glutathione S-transferase
MNDERVLFGIAYSPWTEKARFALAVKHVDYQYREHTPLLGEIRLRRVAGGVLRKASVPLLLDGDRVIMDSFSIAKHGERVGSGPTLFPPGQDGRIRDANDLSERIIAAGRARVMRDLPKHPGAQAEAIPPAFPRALHGVLRPLARQGSEFLARKHGVRRSARANAEAEQREALQQIREQLAGRRTVFDAFSYADIAYAVALQSIRPVADRWLPLGAATRTLWTVPALAEEFADLLAWRDDVYQSWRGG